MNNFLNNLKNKKAVVSILVAIVCIGILAFAYKKRVDKKVNSVEVPYALVELQSREKITSDKIGTVKVAKSMLTDNVITSEKNVLDKYVNYNTTIPKGSLFYTSSVTTWDNMPDSAWSNIENDQTVFSLSIKGNVMVSSSIYPNDIIDLYYQTYDDGVLVYGKLIENIKVIAVKDQNGNHIFEKTANQTSASAIIFAVDEDLHLLLRKASYLSGTIVPVLRNSKYTSSETNKGETKVSSAYIQELINEQTIDVTLDEVSGSEEEITVDGEEIVVEEGTTTE